MPATVTLTRHGDVVELLNDERFQVPPMPPAGPAVDMRWLRATVSRFSVGDIHARRRRLCQDDLDRMTPAELRTKAAELAMTLPIEQIAVEVLADALGLETSVYESVAAVAAGYLPGADAGPRGDDAVKDLVKAFGGVPDEATAAHIAVLVQACNATAALIVNAHSARQHHASRAETVTETLRFDPPVPVMRRVCVASAQIGGQTLEPGDTVVLDVKAANRDPDAFDDPDRFHAGQPGEHLTFGAGVRPCPGREHAVAIAVGALETLTRGDLA